MKLSALFILLVVSTCHYTTAETMLEKGKETVQTGAEMVRDKAEAMKESVKGGAESVKDTVKGGAESVKDTVKGGAESVKGTVSDWGDKAQGFWEKSGAAFRDASQAVRDGIKSITPEFLQKAEPESKLQDWKTKASTQALKELDAAANLLEEANNQVKDIMTQGGADAKAKMTKLRLSVDHAVRQSMKAFTSLKTQADREGAPQTLVDRLKAGWTATTSGVESLKDFVVNAYRKDEDKHEITQDLDATFKQWEKFKAAASEKLEAGKEAASNKLQATKEAAGDTLQATKDAASDKLHATKEAVSDKLHATKEAAMDAAQTTKETAQNGAHAAKEATQNAAHSAKQTASETLQAAKDAVNGGEL